MNVFLVFRRCAFGGRSFGGKRDPSRILLTADQEILVGGCVREGPAKRRRSSEAKGYTGDDLNKLGLADPVRRGSRFAPGGATGCDDY